MMKSQRQKYIIIFFPFLLFLIKREIQKLFILIDIFFLRTGHPSNGNPLVLSRNFINHICPVCPHIPFTAQMQAFKGVKESSLELFQ